MHDIVVLENLCFLASTRKREFGVFKSPLWGPLSGDLFLWYPLRPFSCGRKAKNTLIRVDRVLNSCSQMLLMRQMNRPFMSKTSALHEHHAYLYFASSSAARRELPNATFCGGPRYHGDEILLLDPDAVLRIQIQEISSTFFNLKNVT